MRGAILNRVRSGSIVATALLTIVVLAGGSPAQAAPQPAAPAAPAAPAVQQAVGPQRYHQRVKISKTVHRAANYWGYLRYHAVTRGGRTLDYAKAVRYSTSAKGKKQAGKYAVDWRRQYAAGFQYAGGRVTHVSKSERAKIDAWLRGPLPLSAASPPDCGGASKVVLVRNVNGYSTYDTYLDACQSYDRIHLQTTIGVFCGAQGVSGFTEKFAKIKPIRIVREVALMCAAWAGASIDQLNRLRAGSTTNSLIERTIIKNGPDSTNPQNAGGGALIFYADYRSQCPCRTPR